MCLANFFFKFKEGLAIKTISWVSLTSIVVHCLLLLDDALFDFRNEKNNRVFAWGGDFFDSHLVKQFSRINWTWKHKIHQHSKFKIVGCQIFIDQ